ncbi:MAG: outer membrane protein [Solirubrobacterales bacterium]|jgi:putative membrane protein|nr:outer membrane protein [Solirubrobacterales bacterium]
MRKLALAGVVPAAIAAVLAGTGFAGAHRVHQTAAAKPCGEDQTSLTTSIEGDRFEVAGGKLALQKSTNPAVRKLGQTLVTDHSKSLSDSVKLAHRLGISVPSKPSPSMQWELATVATFTGTAFDRSYSNLEVLDHQQDISESKDEVKLGCSAAVRNNARQEIPTLRQHLKLAQAAQP